MIDYLLCAPDEATPHAALDPLGFGNVGASGWDDDRVLRVNMQVGETLTKDTDPITGELRTVAKPVLAAGFWIVVSLSLPSDALYALPFCMREADREKAMAGKPYVLRERFTAEQLTAPWSIDPQWAGVNYSNAGA
jgi:hypothetical protein